MRPRSRESAGKLLLTAGMAVLGLGMILPFVWMIGTSVKTPNEVFEYPIRWFPSQPEWKHHLKVWDGPDGFAPYYWNSIKVATVSMIGATFLSALAAYGFSRIEFKGRDPLFLLYLSMMMIPPQVLFVPKFILFDRIGIYNTHWALILPGMFTIFGVFLLRQFFMAIPKELTESAFIDGAGHGRIFVRLMLPLAKPALATLAVIDFSWHWNDYENALVFLTDRKLYTVPLGLQNYVLEFNVDYNGMMAAATAGIVPMLIVFLLGQRFIIQGLTGTAVKG
ncbi:carbohydrate ABC transporter permease [Paenibacillus flagellatus]|uniref:Sugar ABC transporter ATP-binding protein n=1 Tax=Paenibacillus flagellatus TaxID=2211139 RepID=A0A2V5JYY0_9BACL|nr:carbohydrate ABC transporter permease [Paenibacillus flagellatus]PYI52115.1 sugar ABC transporter ATP-binding protein [Paenibacillus flagellatus]